MFSPRQVQVMEDFFLNVKCNKQVESILKNSELLINFRVNGILAKKPCFVYAVKIDLKGLILRVFEKNDLQRMYITTVDTNSFHALKQDQSLHVTFGGFVENLIKILEDCEAGKLEISLIQLQGLSTMDEGGGGCPGDNFQLQFFEMRSFKNLIHLCLPAKLAPLNVVIFYMNDWIETLKKKNSAQELAVQSLQNEVHTHMQRIVQFELENTKLREELVENTKSIKQRHYEEMQQLQESLKKASEQRHNDNERSRKTIGALQSQLDQLASEKARILSEKCQEQKRSDSLKDEIISLKSQISNLEQRNERLHTDIGSLKNEERKQEMHLNDMRKHISDLQEKLQKYDKLKSDLIAELEAEKKISQTKRNALEITTEEISKANEIIVRQSQELIKLKNTIGWRTEVALQQEKVINEKDKQLQMSQQQIIEMQQTINSLRKEIPLELESMRKFANSLELKYTEQIKALKTVLISGKENLSVQSIPLCDRIHK